MKDGIAMKSADMRFNEIACMNMVGQEFTKYRCDRFGVTNSVTQIVGIYIGDQVYSLTNIQEGVDYFGSLEDVGVFKMTKSQDSSIHSAFKNVEQIDTPVMGKIQSIKLVNECQKISKENIITYEVWLTRAIIFCMEECEIMFEKDTVFFSEEIIIHRGYDLINMVSPETEFLEGWDEYITPECTRVICEIK